MTTIITALLSGAVFGAIITGLFKYRIEKDKWPRAREDAIANDLREAIQQLTINASSALHSMCWLTWVARERKESLTQDKIDQYDREIHELMPKINGFLVSVAALDKKSYDLISPSVKKVAEMDWKIGHASIRFNLDQNSSAVKLGNLHADVASLDASFPNDLANIISHRIQERAESVEQYHHFANCLAQRSLFRKNKD